MRLFFFPVRHGASESCVPSLLAFTLSLDELSGQFMTPGFLSPPIQGGAPGSYTHLLPEQHLRLHFSNQNSTLLQPLVPIFIFSVIAFPFLLSSPSFGFPTSSHDVQVRNLLNELFSSHPAPWPISLLAGLPASRFANPQHLIPH